MKKTAVTIILAAMLAACGQQQTGPGATAAQERHENFEALGASFKKLSDEAKKPSPDTAIISARAAEIAVFSEALPTWFPAGSGPQDGIKTDALEAVWTEPAKFAEKAEAFKTAAFALRDSEPGAAVANAGKLGATCKGCHENFRKK